MFELYIALSKTVYYIGYVIIMTENIFFIIYSLL